MAPDMLWNTVLTFGFAMLSWFVKGYVDELKRVAMLLNTTREQVAREYITKGEVHADINRVMHRLEALDAKLDRLLESRSKGA